VGGSFDERILGGNDFVEKMLREADGKIKTQFPRRDQETEIRGVVSHLCAEARVKLTELRSGSRRKPVSAVRSSAARRLVEDYGISLAETARYLGVTTSAISKILREERCHNNSTNSRTSPNS
jgi:DNA invertase Pin-like site-specific DNA recombinase